MKNRPMRSKPSFGRALALCAVLAFGGANAAAAQGVSIVSDAETENMLRDYADPLLKVAGLVLAAGLGYLPLFLFAAVSYLLALAWIHLMLPIIRQVDDDRAGAPPPLAH